MILPRYLDRLWCRQFAAAHVATCLELHSVWRVAGTHRRETEAPRDDFGSDAISEKELINQVDITLRCMWLLILR